MNGLCTRFSRPLRRLLLLAALLLGTHAIVEAQPWREWRDTTLPAIALPDLYESYTTFPLSCYILSFDNRFPLTNIWKYADTMQFDNILRWVWKDGDWAGRDNEYDNLLALAPPGKRVIPWIGYSGGHGSFIEEATRARELLFFPFDSSQLRRAPVVSTNRMEFLFMQYAYDSLGHNVNNIIDGDTATEAVYFTSSANTIVASNISFRHTADRYYRWDSIYESGTWRAPRNDDYDSVVNADALFAGVPYYWYTRDTGTNELSEHGNRNVSHRSPHFLLVKGHLFPNGTAQPSDPLLRIRVYYEIDRGKTYIDSSGTPQTADTNLRLLYEIVDITKADLFPLPGNPLNWNAYREVVREINFQTNGGMSGPTDTISTILGAIPVTAQRIDIEVEYLGGEKVALHAVGVRDKIAQILRSDGAVTEAYRDSLEAEIFDLARAYVQNGQNVISDSVFAIEITDEPVYEDFFGFRIVNEFMKSNFTNANGDSLAAQHGDASPHLQHLGYSDWIQMLSYYGGADPEKEDRWKPHMNLPADRIATVPEHNGGRFSIPILFPLDSLATPEFIDVARARIESMNEVFQLGALGAADMDETAYPFDRTRMQHHYRIARLTRQSGKRLRVVLGPVGVMKFTRWVDSLSAVHLDTFAYHFPEASELRVLASVGLAYGAKAFRYYAAEPVPFVDTASDGLPVGQFEQMFVDWGLVTPTDNVQDWTIYKSGWPSHDSVAVIPNLYTGFKAIHDEMLVLNERLRQLGPYMLDLRWRDAYSVHWQDKRPGNDKDAGRSTRAIPSNELVTFYGARHPITGVQDPSYASYVELGLFETKIGTTGGVRDRWKDTNVLYLVNRRIFETGNYDQNEIGYGNDVKAVLDTLTETRTLRFAVHLSDDNLGDEQYQYVRVRQVAPDLTPLPLIGTPHVLDTIIGADQLFEVTLGPGRGTLVEITRKLPDESIVGGVLTRNNQRKMIFDPQRQRYFCTYHKYDSNASDWHVYMRSSLPVDSTGTILWSPLEMKISGMLQAFDEPRTLNSHPSITSRHVNDSLFRLSVVWTAHPNDTSQAGKREVLIRDVMFHTNTSSGDTVEFIDFANIYSVSFHEGENPEEWGTPIISSVSMPYHGDLGDYIAWSDSVVGITARGRLLDTTFFYTPSWTPKDTINAEYMNQLGYPAGQYPAMPPYSHRALGQSSMPIVWQQPGLLPSYVGVVYGRLNYIPPATGPAILYTFDPNMIWITPNHNWGSGSGFYLHPSIDQSQDALGRIMEGITWENNFSNSNPFVTKYFTSVYFRSFLFDTALGTSIPVGNSINYVDEFINSDPGFGLPVVSSQNRVLVPADSNDPALFSVAYMQSIDPSPMNLLQAEWLENQTPEWYLVGNQLMETYTWGGFTPNGTASEGNLGNRYAALYVRTSDSLLRTSRQFFARLRPDNYIAEGRELTVTLNDSLACGIHARLYDVWTSTGSTATGRAVGNIVGSDSLSDLLSCLHSDPFTVFDSVRMGADLYVRLWTRDSAGTSGEHVDIITELVDSATGDIIAILDSMRLDGVGQDYYVELDTTLDLIGSTYEIRVRLESSLTTGDLPVDSTLAWTMTELRGWIPGVSGRRALRLGSVSGNSPRISAQPNPFDDRTEIRFSIQHDERVTVVIVDASGREVARPVRDEPFEAGRYAVEFETGNLVEGTYVMELRAGSARAVEKLIVRH